jgi:hypothetical protein
LRVQKDIETQWQDLRRHLAPRYVSGSRGERDPDLEHVPEIVVQVAPKSQNGAGCRLVSCRDKINPYEYRIALRPGMDIFNTRENPEYFHVDCFEKLADLSSPEILPFLFVETLVGNRNGGCLLDSGAEILVREFIARHGGNSKLAPSNPPSERVPLMEVSSNNHDQAVTAKAWDSLARSLTKEEAGRNALSQALAGWTDYKVSIIAQS